MGKYIAVWQLVLEAAQSLNKPFTTNDITKKIQEKHPNVNKRTVYCHVIGMTPNHSSSKHYPSLSKNHPVFNHMDNGMFELLANSKLQNNDNAKIIENIAVENPTWEKITDKITELQSYLAPFRVEFLDRDSFKKFCDNLQSNLTNLKDICLTGYFSETIRDEIEKLAQNKYYNIRLISPDFQVGTPRDKKNLEALRKLSKAGVEVRFNYRLHARMIIAKTNLTGLLILGSFDLNTECIGKERYDAGIKTRNPDLIHSAIAFFDQVWNDSETQSLEQFLKEKKISP